MAHDNNQNVTEKQLLVCCQICFRFCVFFFFIVVVVVIIFAVPFCQFCQFHFNGHEENQCLLCFDEWMQGLFCCAHFINTKQKHIEDEKCVFVENENQWARSKSISNSVLENISPEIPAGKRVDRNYSLVECIVQKNDSTCARQKGINKKTTRQSTSEYHSFIEWHRSFLCSVSLLQTASQEPIGI